VEGLAVSVRQAVAIPLYKEVLSSAEVQSIERTLSLLAEHDIFIVGPQSLKPYLLMLSKKYDDRLKIQLFSDGFFTSIAGYNQLLMSERFYAAFEAYQYLLIVQTDALVLKNELSSWCEKGYSYIGAPIFEGFTTPTQPLQCLSIGNGGFSLRKVADFLKVLRRPYLFKNKLMEHWPGNWLSCCYRYLKDYWCYSFKNTQINVSVNEDIFWGLFVPARCEYFQVPAPSEASKFAFDAAPKDLYWQNNQQLPFGCHAGERYDRSFWVQVFADHQIKIQ
jgi:hypothetical protein